MKSVIGSLPGLFISVNLNIKTSAFHLFETMIKKSKNNIWRGKNKFNKNYLSGDNNQNIEDDLQECSSNDLQESSLDYSLSINNLLSYSMISNINDIKDNNQIKKINYKNNNKDNERKVAYETLNNFLKNIKHILNFFKTSFFSKKDNNYNNLNKTNLPKSLIELLLDFDKLFEIVLKIIFENFNIDLQKKTNLLQNQKVENNKMNNRVIDEMLSKENVLLAKRIEEVSKAMDSLGREECSSNFSDHSGERSLRLSKDLSDQLLLFSNIQGMVYCKKLSDSHTIFDRRNDNNNNNNDNDNNNNNNNKNNNNINNNKNYRINSNPFAPPIIIIDDDDNDDDDEKISNEGKQKMIANQNIINGK